MRRLAEGLLWLASKIVPRELREAWLEEWRAELWHGASTGAGGVSLVRAALGSGRDALAVRRLGATRADASGWGAASTTATEGMMAMGREIRVAARSLARAPAFAAVAVLTLGVGMGGATAVYTLLDRVVLDPLPYPESDRLVRLRNQVPGVGPDERWHLATGQYVLYNDAAPSLETVGVWRRTGANVETPTGARRVRAALVSAEMMELLGADARLGRVIDAEDDRPEAARVVLLSHAAWTRSWGGDPDVVGRTVRVDGEPLEVVGVLRPGLDLPAEAGAPTGGAPELWTPIQIDRGGPHWNSHVYSSVGRLAPGTTPGEAEAELAELMPRLPELFPRAYSQDFFDRYGFRQVVTPLKVDVVGDMARNLWILMGAVGLVLLIAGANVVNLFLARMEDRRRELSVRAALGAGRAAIARYLLAESLVLGAVGGALAVVVSHLGLTFLGASAPSTLPRLDEVGLDGTALLFAAALSVGVGLALALVTLVRLGGLRDLGALGEGGRASSAGRGRRRLRDGLVVAQVALALTLVVGAGLLLSSLQRLRSVDPGFDPEGTLTAELHLTPSAYPRPEAVWPFLDQLLERVRGLPGVTAAGMSPGMPLTGAYGCTVQGFEDATVYQRVEDAGLTTCAGQEVTTPGYFEAMGIPLLSGRTFVDADNDDPERGVAVVSRAYAERFWPGEDPLGKGIAPSGMSEGPFYRVVGVVGDVKNASLAEGPAVVVYYPIRPIPPTRFTWPGSQTLVVRTGRADPLSVLPAVREVVRSLDATVPLADVRTMEQVVGSSMSRVHFVSILLEAAALAALLLAAVGLYGVISYVVTRRTREIGMRMAMGARPGRVQREIVSRSMGLTVTGLVVGVVLALGTSRVLEGLLFEVEPTHPAAFAGAAALLTAVAFLAAWLPARKAAGIDPSEALRAE